MSLTREQILNVNDIKVKEIKVEQWGGTVFIRQLTRGEQDKYLKRQYGTTRMKQDMRAKQQEISAVNIYGHDAFLCACGICDKDGKRLFSNRDIQELEKKNGEAIGEIAAAIVEFSGMGAEVDELKDLQDTKN